MASGSERLRWALFIFVGIGLLISGIHPKDRFTWFLEILPILITAPILLWTFRSFPLTSMLYFLIALHAMVLMIGGHYTYAEVPLGYWLRDFYGGTRNNYDHIGHFFQGYVPAIAAREVLLRRSPLKPGKWLNYIVWSICLSISALYELFEWQTAIWTGASSDAFLGTQGDPWDTQEDMFFCAIGAFMALLTLSRLHDRQLKSQMQTIESPEPDSRESARSVQE